MSRKIWTIVPTALGLAIAVGTWGAAQEPKAPPPKPSAPPSKGAGEVIGETVDGVVETLKRGARATTETLQEQYQHAKTSIQGMGVQARVYSRLHWDKKLGSAKIDIEVKDGTATLRGTVKTLQARVKALDLARDTIGVDRVDDQLKIEPASPGESLEETVKPKT